MQFRVGWHYWAYMDYIIQQSDSQRSLAAEGCFVPCLTTAIASAKRLTESRLPALRHLSGRGLNLEDKGL
jgi:hypothetical protein